MAAAATPTAVVVLTGDELLRGFIQDANGGFLAAELRGLGIHTHSIVVVGDPLEEITAGVRGAADAVGADLVIVCGGLGRRR